MTIIYNARLLSFHDGFDGRGLDAMAFDKGKIVALGKGEELWQLAGGHGGISDPKGSGVQVIDAGGRTLMPGFNDTHIHVWKVGDLKGHKLDLRGAGSLDEMLSSLEAWSRSHPDTPWLTARGFNEAAWKDGRMPTAADLDKVIPDRPVYVIRTCAHIAVANTRAMEIAGITSAVRAPEGGVIHYDASGRPSGVFSETALGLITRHIPAPGQKEMKDMFFLAREEFYCRGITAVTDPAVHPELMEVYQELDGAGGLGIRLNAIPILLPDGGAQPFPLPGLYSSDWLQVDTVKFFSDGGLSGQTAALKRPYKNSIERGVLRLNRGQYSALLRTAMEGGFGVATHAIGDAAIGFVIDMYREFPGMRRRIEHLCLPERGHLETMAREGIAASMQTIFLSELGKNYRRYLDDEYLSHCLPVRSVLDAGILVALSSDAPVVRNFNPLKGVYAAVARRDDEGFVIATDEAIPVHEALKAYTYSAAALTGRCSGGSLIVGHDADVVLLEGDPLSAPPEELPGLSVSATFIGGDCVYSTL